MKVDENGPRKSVKKTAVLIAIANIFAGFANLLTNSYTAYSWTDLNGLDHKLYASSMTICGFLLTVVACVSGVIITKTRTKWGQAIPWLVVLPPVCMIGGLLTFSGWGNTTVEKVIILCVAYMLAMGTTDLITAARTTLYGKMAGDNYQARTTYVSAHWLGSNVSALVAGAVTLTLVGWFGKNNQQKGFMITELIFTVLVLLGYVILIAAGRKSDIPQNWEKPEKEAAEKIRVSEMLKGIVTNRCICTCILSDVSRFTGYFAMQALMVYQCTYVFDDINAMTLVLTISGFSCIVGNYLAPYVVEKIGGRKKNMEMFGWLTGLSSLAIGVIGKSPVGFTICLSLAFFFMSFIDSVDYAMYLDAGEWHLNKTGKDIRAFFVSMYGLSVKFSQAVSAMVIGGVLGAISYHSGMVLNDAGRTKLSWLTALTMAIGYGVLPTVIMRFHPISDQEMEQIAIENEKRRKS